MAMAFDPGALANTVVTSGGFIFAIGPQLNVGGNAVVYHADVMHKMSRKYRVAAKIVVCIRSAESERHAAQFKDHPHICQLIHSFEVPERCAIFMYELMDMTLHQMIYDKMQFRQDAALQHILSAMIAIHAAGFLHCDLKPTNLMYKADVLKLIDFGLSCRLPQPGATFSDEFNVYTSWYRPPEVALHLPYGVRADAWTIGLIGAEMVRKQPLFRAEKNEDIIGAHSDFFKVRRLRESTLMQYVKPRTLPELVTNPDTLFPAERRCLEHSIPFLYPSPTQRADASSVAAQLKASGWVPDRLLLNVRTR